LYLVIGWPIAWKITRDIVRERLLPSSPTKRGKDDTEQCWMAACVALAAWSLWWLVVVMFVLYVVGRMVRRAAR
jgi:hypothetical protein